MLPDIAIEVEIMRVQKSSNILGKVGCYFVGYTITRDRNRLCGGIVGDSRMVSLRSQYTDVITTSYTLQPELK